MRTLRRNATFVPPGIAARGVVRRGAGGCSTVVVGGFGCVCWGVACWAGHACFGGVAVASAERACRGVAVARTFGGAVAESESERDAICRAFAFGRAVCRAFVGGT